MRLETRGSSQKQLAVLENGRLRLKTAVAAGYGRLVTEMVWICVVGVDNG